MVQLVPGATAGRRRTLEGRAANEGLASGTIAGWTVAGWTVAVLSVMSPIVMSLTVPAHASEQPIILPEIEISAAPRLDSNAQARAKLDAARDRLLPKIGATSITLGRAAIEAQPQGDNTPFDKLILQLPGVSADSAASHPDFHIRNEYSNVQYRINGILVPDGVSGLGPILDTSFVGSLTLLTGTLPAQYGLRTAGVVDITTRDFVTPGGSVSLYGGSHGTVQTRLDYGGTSGATQYFIGLSGFRGNVGIENPTPSHDPIHDRTEQGKALLYLSSTLSDSARLSFISGASVSQFQIPNIPGLQPLGDFGGPNANSLALNERENDKYFYDIMALQTSEGRLDTQLATFTRYAQVHFVPDVPGDLAFDDVASDVARRSILTGLQGDAAYRLDARQTLRAGFGFTAEQSNNDSLLTALKLDAAGQPLPLPVTFGDNNSKLGFNVGGYVQDEVRLTDTLTIDGGLRFDQLYQYVTASQLSPRLAAVYRPDEATSVHAGYARYFTPPSQSEAASSDIALSRGTTLAPQVPLAGPALPERAHYFDVGVDRTLQPGLTAGLDGYYKITTDLIDDGQFGQAQVLSQLNYAKGWSEGLELKARYQSGGLTAYGNVSTGRTKDTGPVSNQYVLDADEYAYISRHYIFADDVQLITASAGASYRLGKTLLTADMIYGSGLRAGFANLDHVPAYTQVNLGIAHDFVLADPARPLIARFDIVNAFDTIYQLRDGSGIGVFAPQYGPRRGFYLGLTQKL